VKSRVAAALVAALAVASVVHAQPANQPPAPPASGAGAPATPPGQVPPPAPRPVNTQPLVLDQKDADELKDVEQEFDRFTQAAADHEQRMRTIAKREFDTRSADLDRRYADRIARTEGDRGKRHDDTIALLVKFLANHPSHDTFTPDAMFRLADLYLDQADEEVEARLAATEGSNAPAAGSGSGGEQAIIADYSKSLDLWEDILRRFPSYRQTPSTLYLLAYYGKTKDERRSLEEFLALTCANKYKWDAQPPQPPTREQAIKRVEAKALRDPYADCTAYPGADPELIQHAWVRGIADYHFTVPGELDEAIASYRKVADTAKDSKLYAESLYKLAWSYYKRDFLEDSIKRFDDSVKLYDQIIAAGDQPPLELRDESIQYIAVALTDPWEGETDTDPVKAFARAEKMYKGRENEPHVRDVWVALGKAFSDLQAWDQSVDSYRIAIGPPWELDPHNPVVHQEIVNVYEAKGDKFAADQAAADLATKYAPGTPWYAANEKDREAMEAQRRISERALYAAAINTNTAAKVQREDYEASAKKDPAAKDAYVALYNKAYTLYRQFLDTYPDSDYVYEFNYKMGDSLFYGERYLDAAQQFRWVRDHRDLGTSHYVDAARSVVSSLQAEADRQVASGRLAALKVPTADELKALLNGGSTFTPQPIPDVYLQLQNEFDNYQQHVQDPAEAPKQGINAALISLGYLHIDDAIRRLKSVMDQFCKTPPPDPKDPKSLPYSSRAKDGLLAIYEATGNLDAFEQTNKAYIDNQCGTAASIDIAISQNRSLNFQRASKLFEEKQYIPAGDAFYKFYKTAPAKDPDLPSALYSSAVSYFLGERPKTAISLFKEFTANSDKAYRDSPYYLRAMGLTAASYQSSFDYDNAVATYLTLYDTARRAKARGAKPPPPLPGEPARTLDQIALDALFNAAFAAELNRDFRKATDLYGQYDRVETDRKKKDNALWEVAGIYKQSGDIGNMVDTLDRWRRLYGRDADNTDRYVQSFYDTATAWQRKGRTSQAIAAGADTVTAWKTVGSPPKGKAAKMAGEWALAAAEQQFHTRWEPYEIKTAANTVAQAKAQGAALLKLRDDLEAKYKELDAYGVAEYSMASIVRFGDLEEQYALKLGAAPMPAPVQASCATNPDICEKYQAAIDAAVKKDTDAARDAWKDVDDAAKKGGISNKWSQQAREELAREFPDQFKALHQEIVQGTDAP
jgi:TolA-binding protein